MNKKKTLIALIIILVSLISPPMALVNVGVGISAIRILSLTKWFIVATILLWIIRPARKEIKCAMLTGIFVAVVDLIGEVVGISLGLWSYQGKQSIWGVPRINPFGILRGVPVDVPLYFFLAAFVFCLGYSLFRGLRFQRLARIIYILSWGIILGIVGYLVNIWAPRTGFVLIAEEVGPGRPIYFIFFVFFGFFLSGLFAFVYHLCSKINLFQCGFETEG